jgi:hypothetical protein
VRVDHWEEWQWQNVVVPRNAGDVARPVEICLRPGARSGSETQVAGLPQRPVHERGRGAQTAGLFRSEFPIPRQTPGSIRIFRTLRPLGEPLFAWRETARGGRGAKVHARRPVRSAAGVSGIARLRPARGNRRVVDRAKTERGKRQHPEPAFGDHHLPAHGPATARVPGERRVQSRGGGGAEVPGRIHPAGSEPL